NQLKGWLWGTDDGVQSWGKNIITGTTGGFADDGSPVADSRIYWTFDRNGIAHEAAISNGDSGGGDFVKVGNIWRLAGVNNAVQAEFSLPNSNVVQDAALMDFGGLVNNGQLVPDTSQDVPAQNYSTRISTRVSWIYDVLAGRVAPSASLSVGVSGAVPEPGFAGIVWLVGILLGDRPGRKRPAC
ncbi:MAG TPA: hypothetical protein VKK61_05715, partial [Tepidisphaeraceae bacterium]|nr:hypothetical protein [Tepidisphaeraceae bacterium]